MTHTYNGITYETAVEALTAARKSRHPTGEYWRCYRCQKEFPLNRPDGSYSITCTHCGHCPTEENAAGALRYFKEGDAREAKEAAAERVKLYAQAAKARVRPAPPHLDDVIGNGEAVMQIRTALDAHKGRKGAADAPEWLSFPHLLLSGPGGTGKTMLSEIVARELGAKIHLQMGQVLSTPAKVAEVLLGLNPGDVLFIDEIHGLKTPCQEAMYRAMEDGVLVPQIRAGHGEGKPIALPPFTVIGATTDEWGLLPSLCQRFKYRVRLQRMTAAEIAEAIGRRAKRMHLEADAEAIGLIAERSLGTPRLAIGLMDGCLDTAVAQRGKAITRDIVRLTCQIWGIDSLGLDRVARTYLGYLRDMGGGPVRLNVLAAKLDGLAKTTVERKVEPDLVWLGLIEKQANGRILTAAGREHLRKEL